MDEILLHPRGVKYDRKLAMPGQDITFLEYANENYNEESLAPGIVNCIRRLTAKREQQRGQRNPPRPAARPHPHRRDQDRDRDSHNRNNKRGRSDRSSSDHRQSGTRSRHN